MKKIYGICLFVGFLFIGLWLFPSLATKFLLTDEPSSSENNIQELTTNNNSPPSPTVDPYPAPTQRTESNRYPAPSNVTLLSNRNGESQTRVQLSAKANTESEQNSDATVSLSEQPYQLFIPLVAFDLQRKGALITGVQVGPGRGADVAQKAEEAKISWVRYNGFGWSDVEPQPGEYNWEALSGFENDLDMLIGQGLTPIVTIRGTPEWAQKVPGAYCGPIREDALDDFANFMQKMVSRYSGRPFDVVYWEIGNEPDIDPSLISPTEPFGCWGDKNDPFYGGGYYAEMLKVVYPVIKQANPRAKVLLGGLVLDCDPTAPPVGKDCLSSKFFEGILQNGGGQAFDMVAYHIYPFWEPTVVDPDLTHVAWQHRGGLLLGKLNYMREVMADYNINKPILMNEGALICHDKNEACPSDAFFDAQANYLHRLYARGWANGLHGIIWYTLNGPGWREGGLLDESGNPRPAYTALSFLGQLLGQATVNRQLSKGELEGYSFNNEINEIQLYWSNDPEIHSIPLPPNTQAIYDKLGQPQPLTDPILVGVDPIYIHILR